MKTFLRVFLLVLMSNCLFAQNVKFTVYSQSNTPTFTTNSFRQVAVGKDSTIWVGSAGSGVYRFDGISWAKAPVLLTHSIRTIMRAPDSSIVIGQSGSNAVQATNGGVDRFATTAFTNTHYGMGNGLPSRYVNSLCISNNGTIWSGNGQDLTGSTTDEGGIAYMPAGASSFTKITAGLPASDIRIMAIGCSNTEVWAGIDRACPPGGCISSGILIYSLQGNFIGKIDATNSPIPFATTNIIVRGICFTPAGNAWVGFNTNGGLAVNDGGVWTYITTGGSILPAGCAINANAMKSDRSGRVYIGTTMGLLVYKGGPVNNPASYTLYTTANGLPSNNVTGIESYDLKTTWLTTGAGIVKMEESFLPNPNGWRFSNSRANMWPMSLWAAYDYNFDPYLGGTAPFPLNGGNVIASSSFPDWPLFVDLLGEDQCYFESGGVKFIRTLAMNKYFAMIGNWGGSCQGFVETSFMVWDSIDYFRNKYPAVGPWTSDKLYDLPINDENRKVINKLMISQNQTPYYAFSNSRTNVTPNQTLADLKVMLKSDTKNLKGLNLYNQHGKGAHIVNPYKVTKDPVEPNLEYIYVYDNNFPNDTTRKVWVDKAQNAWYYNLSVNSGVASKEWGGPDCHKGLNLDTTVRYWYQPIALGNIGKKQPMKLLPATGNVEVYNSDSCDISIANASGQNIGCIGGTIVNTIPDALALRYFSLDELSPKGYFLPDNQYDAEMRSFSKKSVRFTVFNSTTSYEYTRTGTSLDQRDRIHIGTEGIHVQNPDTAPKSINLSCTFEDAGSEMRVEISNIGSLSNAITEIQRFNSSEVKLFNSGNSTKYDLRIRYVSYSGESAFLHDSIEIPANTAHVISPDWENLKTALMKVFVDNANNLSYEDTLYFGNSEQPQFLSNPTLINNPKTQLWDTVYIVNSGGGTLNWTAISSDTSWLKLSGLATGTDNGSVILFCEPNTGSARSGNITFVAPGASNSPYLVKVKQDGKFAAPAGLYASDGTSAAGVGLSWRKSDSASYYRAYRAENAGGLFVPLSHWSVDTTFADTTSVKGKFYYYAVKAALDSLGSDSTDLSAKDDGWRSGFTADFSYIGECAAQAVQFSEACTAHEKIHYLWDINNDGTTDFTGAKFEYSFPVSGSYEVKLTATDSSSVTESVLKTILIKAFPQLSLKTDTIVCAGESVVLDAGSGFASYLWSTGATTSSLTIDSTGYGYGKTTVYVDVSSQNGCRVVAAANITWDTCAPVGGFSLSGNVTYDNTVSTPLTNTQVRVIQSGSVVYETTTDAQGHYSFTNIPNGNYEISTVCTKPWGGVNSIDALIVLRKFAAMVNLQGLRLLAADVNASNSVNSVDALLVAKRFVAMISSFAAGDWVFDHPVITVSGPGNQVQNIKGVVYGDVDGSYLPLQ